MRTSETLLLDFIRQSPQFRIPVNQRRYAWTRRHCRQLWDDIEGGGHLLALDGWQMEGKKAIVGHGGRGAFVVREERRFDNEFLPHGNGLRYVRHPKIRHTVNNPG